MSISSLGNTITLFGRIADTQKMRKPILSEPVRKPPCRITSVKQPLPRVRPEEIGLDSARIAAFLAELSQDETLNMHSVLILRNGKIVTEATFGEHSLHTWKQTYSACKSITALAVGMLVEDRMLSLDEKLTDLFDARLTPLSRITAKDLTVRHLLTMTTGASFNEASVHSEKDWIKGYFGGSFSPGAFSYNSLNSYMLSAIVGIKTGMRLSEFLNERLFQPLGITEYHWECCPLGIDKGGWGLFLLPEDMAKIGLLVMQDGVWMGRQLVSRDWIREATAVQVSAEAVSKLYDYGYHIWCGREKNSFLFNGMLGQNVLGLRDSGVLLVTNAGNDEIFQSSIYFTAAERYFGASLPDVLPQNDAAYQTLCKTVASLKEHVPRKAVPKQPLWKKLIPVKKAAPAPALPGECALLSGVRFTSDDPNAPSVSLMPLTLQVVQNNYGSGFSSVSFLANGDTFYMTFTEAEARYLLPVGFGVSADADLSFGGVPYHVKTLGQFLKDEDGRPLLKIRVTFTETPLTRYFKIYYTGVHPFLKAYEQPGSEFIFSRLLSLQDMFTASPLLTGAIGKIDRDFVRYRVYKAFSPEIRLQKASEQAKVPANVP